MISIIKCTIICLTVIIVTALLLHKGLPTVKVLRMYKDITESSDTPPTPVGFAETPEPEKPQEDSELSDKEKMENLLKDAASTITALCRGEVDIDELS